MWGVVPTGWGQWQHRGSENNIKHLVGGGNEGKKQHRNNNNNNNNLSDKKTLSDSNTGWNFWQPHYMLVVGVFLHSHMLQKMTVFRLANCAWCVMVGMAPLSLIRQLHCVRICMCRCVWWGSPTLLKLCWPHHTSGWWCSVLKNDLSLGTRPLPVARP